MEKFANEKNKKTRGRTKVDATCTVGEDEEDDECDDDGEDDEESLSDEEYCDSGAEQSIADEHEKGPPCLVQKESPFVPSPEQTYACETVSLRDDEEEGLMALSLTARLARRRQL
eukprot:GILK01003529.1.p4 GENE.GILK01003529.1~~GILK01003529.1.p4  ORF type:complete len:115 (-),score=25.14 GILK01003529.1:157-501(-)